MHIVSDHALIVFFLAAITDRRNLLEPEHGMIRYELQ